MYGYYCLYLLELVSKSKVRTGRNLTMLTRKRQREVPTKKYWWKQPQVIEGGDKTAEICVSVLIFVLLGFQQSNISKTNTVNIIVV